MSATCEDCGRPKGSGLGVCLVGHIGCDLTCDILTIARLRAESAELKQKVSDLEAETMTLTSERDTARMGQDELLAKLRSEGQDWRLAAAAFEADAAEIAELRGQLEGANGYAKSYLDASHASRDRIAELESNLSDMTKLRDEADGQFCGALDRIGAMHAELASAQRVASALEWLASREDTKERLARADGAFNLAVCHQQYAAWWRSGTPTQAIRGTEGKTLVAHVSDGLVITEGDAMTDPDALYSIAVAIYPAAQRVAALSEAERAVVDARMAQFVASGESAKRAWRFIVLQACEELLVLRAEAAGKVETDD